MLDNAPGAARRTGPAAPVTAGRLTERGAAVGEPLEPTLAGGRGLHQMLHPPGEHDGTSGRKC